MREYVVRGGGCRERRRDVHDVRSVHLVVAACWTYRIWAFACVGDSHFQVVAVRAHARSFTDKSAPGELKSIFE